MHIYGMNGHDAVRKDVGNLMAVNWQDNIMTV